MKKVIKKVNKKTKTLVNFILDKSGSMCSVSDATISGFNEYINTLKKDGNEYDFSLTLFDTEVSEKYVSKPLKSIDELDKKSYVTDGMTALYDAVCKTVKGVKKSVSKGTKVLTVIMTDGQENSSKEYTEKNMKELVKELEATKLWSFIYLGANQDAWANAGAWGLSSGNVSNFNATGAGINAVFTAMACNTSAFGGGGAGSTQSFFSKDDQDKLKATK